MKIRFICKNCGSVNEKEKDVLTDPDYSQEDWLCDLPVGFEWILPVGKITPVVGSPLYVSSLGAISPARSILTGTLSILR